MVRASCALIALTAPPVAADPLFLQPLHITREIDDPIAEKTLVIEEYLEGDRVVAVREDVVAVADYARGELLRIDHAAGTWSLISFQDLARTNAMLAPNERAPAHAERALERTGVFTRLGRPVEVFRSAAGSEPRIEVSIDRSVNLSRAATEVIVGTAYPNAVNAEARAVLAAAAPPNASGGVTAMASSVYGLPLETVVTFRAGMEELVLRNRIVHVAFERAPPGLLEIPPGARRVEDERLEAGRLLESLDRPSSGVPPRR
jgi:hypothetical protein